jgi:hypothetical protein
MIRLAFRFLLVLAIAVAVALAMRTAYAQEPGALLRMFDYGTDLEARYGVPIGAVHQWAWDEINPARGVYHWDDIDAALAAEAALGKAVQSQIIFYYSSTSRPGWNYGYYDATPQWVYQGVPHDTLGGRSVGHVISDASGNKTACPAYDQPAWRAAYLDMVRAFAARYDGKIDSVVISVGLDGETQPTKGSWLTAMRGTAIEYRFGQFVYEAMDVYAAAFDATQPYINNAPGGEARKPRAEYAAALGIGIKHSGLKPDLDSYTGYGSAVGSWDMMNVYSTTLPLWIESAYGWMDAGNRYWALPAALHYHPAGIDLHAGWYDDLSREQVRWLYEHVRARTPQDAPSVWTVLRDAEYPLQGSVTGYGVSGKCGNWEYWLYQTNQSDTPMVARPHIPAAADAIESRQCRRGDVFTFQIDPRFVAAAYDVTVTYLDYGAGAWAVNGQGARRANTGQWQRVTFRTTGRALRVTGEALYLHRVDVSRAYGDKTPTFAPITPSVLPSVQIITKTVTIGTQTKTATLPILGTNVPKTGTPTATSSQTWQPTATATRTETPTVPPSVTATLSSFPTLAPTVPVRKAEMVCISYRILYDDGTQETIEGPCHGGGK